MRPCRSSIGAQSRPEKHAGEPGRCRSGRAACRGARGCDATCTMLWFVPIGRGGCWMSRAPTRGSKRLPYKAIEIFMGAIVAMQHLFDYSAAVSSTLLFRCGFSPSPKVLGLFFASGRRAGGVFDCGHTGSRQARKRMRKQVGSKQARQEVGSPIGHPRHQGRTNFCGAL